MSQSKYGRFETPQQLIESVELQFYHSDRSHLHIADNCQVDLFTVCGVIAHSWGDPAWYAQSNAQSALNTPVERRGRPHKPETEKSGDTLHVRVKAADKAAWEALAQSANMSLSAWVVSKLNRTVR